VSICVLVELKTAGLFASTLVYGYRFASVA